MSSPASAVPRAACGAAQAECASDARRVRAVICPARRRRAAASARAQVAAARSATLAWRVAVTHCSPVMPRAPGRLRRYRRSAAWRLATPRGPTRSAQLTPAPQAASIKPVCHPASCSRTCRGSIRLASTCWAPGRPVSEGSCRASRHVPSTAARAAAAEKDAGPQASVPAVDGWSAAATGTPLGGHQVDDRACVILPMKKLPVSAQRDRAPGGRPRRSGLCRDRAPASRQSGGQARADDFGQSREKLLPSSRCTAGRKLAGRMPALPQGPQVLALLPEGGAADEQLTPMPRRAQGLGVVGGRARGCGPRSARGPSPRPPLQPRPSRIPTA